MSFMHAAAEKLKTEEKNATGLGQKAGAMKSAVAKALREFCGQSERFAEAVCKGRSFEECMKAVAKDVGGSISDLEAYKRAAKFYLPDSSVRFCMEITMGEERPTAAPAAEQEQQAAPEIIDLSAFF